MIQDGDVYRSSGTVSVDLITEFEERMCVRLPEKYKTIISSYNWLRLKCDGFIVLDENGEILERDVSFYGYEVEYFPGSGTIVDVQSVNEFLPDNIVIFGYSVNGDFIGFDYREENSADDPPVCSIFHDVFEKDTVETRMKIARISDNFERFLDILEDI
jgi:hypothetical protein